MTLPADISRRHERFLQQAGWTRQLRLQLLSRLAPDPSLRVLDLGSGTGALFPDLLSARPGAVFALDLNERHLGFAAERFPEVSSTVGDGHRLPYRSDQFALVLCHYTLLWVESPAAVLREMVRAAAPGGTVAALAEPDYGGRIDYPPPLDTIRDLQIQSLKHKGADPEMGRKLAGLFRRAGLQDIQTGVYQGNGSGTNRPDGDQLEWEILHSDLAGLLDPGELQELRRQDIRARREGSRVLYVPTFFAWGKV